MMLIEAACGSVLGVDYHRKNPKLGPRNTYDRVRQKGRTEALALMIAGYSKASEECSRNDRVAGKLGGDFGRKLIEAIPIAASM
jgi:hypothetical protein